MNGKKLHNGHLRPRRGHMLQKMSDFAQDWNQRQEEVHVDLSDNPNQTSIPTGHPAAVFSFKMNFLNAGTGGSYGFVHKIDGSNGTFRSLRGRLLDFEVYVKKSTFSNDLVFDYGAPTA